MEGFNGEHVAFIHAANANDPIGFAVDVDSEAYLRNVLLNSAAPQVLGQLFLAAVRSLQARCHLIMLTSDAVQGVYPGWSSYGAGKAAIDQWVRNVGAEPIWALTSLDLDNGSVIDLRKLDLPQWENPV